MISKKSKRDISIVNSHVHIFTIHHTPSFIRHLQNLAGFFLVGPVVAILDFINIRFDFIDRAIKLFNAVAKKSQRDLMDIIRSHYPKKTKYVILTLDMEYMKGGKSKKNYSYLDQLKNIAQLKANKKFKDVIFPFISVDPNREKADKLVKYYIRKCGYQGIKLYPQTGYFPFPFPYQIYKNGVKVTRGNVVKSKSYEERLSKIFKFAEENNVPIISHCNPGGLRGYKRQYNKHPVTGDPIGFSRKSQTYNLAHPMNYYYLLEQFPDLKICLAHFGGFPDWKRHLKEPLEEYGSSSISAYGKDQIDHYKFNKKNFKHGHRKFVDPVWNPSSYKVEDNTWINVIKTLMTNKKFPNIYADISYNCYDFETISYLNMLLDDPVLCSKIIFGTDFHVVRLQRSEKEYSLGLRVLLGEEKYRKITAINPRKFLRSKFASIPF